MEYFAGKKHCTSCMIHLIPNWLAALNEKHQTIYSLFLAIVIRLFISTSSLAEDSFATRRQDEDMRDTLILRLS
jgi:hypothetical protein